MAGGVNGVVIDVHDFHAVGQGAELFGVHTCDVLVLQGDTARVGCFEYLVAVPAVRRHAVRQNG